MMRQPSFVPTLATVVLALVLGGPAFAQEIETEAFTPERFTELQEQDALILIDVFADWCGTCAQQQEILADFRDAHPDGPVHMLQVDFDRQKEHVRRFRAPRQSTLILFHGGERLWFSVAETNRDRIFAALEGGIATAEAAEAARTSGR